MRILIVCEYNQNRSVTLAGQLKWLGNDVLTCGYKVNMNFTLELLMLWADRVIFVDQIALKEVRDDISDETGRKVDESKFEVWDIGPDVYPRPYNKDLFQKCREFIFEHPEVDNRPLTDKHPEKGIKDPRPKEDNA